MANGWTAVSKSETDESFDVTAKHPDTGEWTTFQVKTIKVRDDRGGDYVVTGRKGNGTTYDKSDADHFIGVLVVEGGPPRLWMFENRGLSEYWSAEKRLGIRWTELPLALDRSHFTKITKSEAV